MILKPDPPPTFHSIILFIGCISKTEMRCQKCLYCNWAVISSGRNSKWQNFSVFLDIFDFLALNLREATLTIGFGSKNLPKFTCQILWPPYQACLELTGLRGEIFVIPPYTLSSKGNAASIHPFFLGLARQMFAFYLNKGKHTIFYGWWFLQY